MKTSEDPRSLREVWEVKEQAFQEVQGFSVADALKMRLDDAIRTAAAVKSELYDRKAA